MTPADDYLAKLAELVKQSIPHVRRRAAKAKAAEQHRRRRGWKPKPQVDGLFPETKP